MYQIQTKSSNFKDLSNLKSAELKKGSSIQARDKNSRYEQGYRRSQKENFFSGTKFRIKFKIRFQKSFL